MYTQVTRYLWSVSLWSMVADDVIIVISGGSRASLGGGVDSKIVETDELFFFYFGSRTQKFSKFSNFFGGALKIFLIDDQFFFCSHIQKFSEKFNFSHFFPFWVSATCDNLLVSWLFLIFTTSQANIHFHFEKSFFQK